MRRRHAVNDSRGCEKNANVLFLDIGKASDYIYQNYKSSALTSLDNDEVVS
jgi:hypothetical protein